MDINKLLKFKEAYLDYWSHRVVMQALYTYQVSRYANNVFDSLVAEVQGKLAEHFKQKGALNADSSKPFEELLRPAYTDCKSYSFHITTHSHIDMNWQWGYEETVSITLDTWRTLIRMLDDYPNLYFGQSQAAMYELCERFDPALLEDVKRKIRDGQWEVTASTWVEADRNMPSGDAFIRHLRKTREYLIRTLPIDVTKLNLAFEPDAFGHSGQLPEILTAAGVTRYYHTRGDDRGPSLYRWSSPSGAEVTVLRDLAGYSPPIGAFSMLRIPEFCNTYHVDVLPQLYGIGNHGGAPYRKGIETFMDMNTWPAFPNVGFSRLDSFFDKVDADALPLVNSERNFVFTGCFSSQSKLKFLNRFGEARAIETEALDAMSSVLAGHTVCRNKLDSAWKHILFNQFHDILPGSNTQESKEYSVGLYQEATALTEVVCRDAMKAICDGIDTTPYLGDVSGELISMSEGAGVGFNVRDGHFPQVERNRGIKRFYTVFNPTPVPRNEPVEIVVWEWEGNLDTARFTSPDGKVLRHQLLDNEKKYFWNDHYWFFKYRQVLVQLELPPYGYSCVILDEAPQEKAPIWTANLPNTRPQTAVLQNGLICAELDMSTGGIKSLTLDGTGEYLRSTAGVSGVIEHGDGNAWTLGAYIETFPLTQMHVTGQFLDEGVLRRWIRLSGKFKSSPIQLTISLDEGATMLDYDIKLECREIGTPETGIPQLRFVAQLCYEVTGYPSDTAFGVLERKPHDDDIPARFMAANGEGRIPLVLSSENGYALRGYDNSLSATLLRASFDPDTAPETGHRQFKVHIGFAGSGKTELARHILTHNIITPVISCERHSGTLPISWSLLSLSGDGVLTSIQPEADGTLIATIFETEGRDGQAHLNCGFTVDSAYLCDAYGTKLDSKLIYEEGCIYVPLPAYKTVFVRIKSR